MATTKMKKLRTYPQYEAAVDRANTLEETADERALTAAEQAEWDALNEAIADYEDAEERRNCPW